MLSEVRMADEDQEPSLVERRRKRAHFHYLWQSVKKLSSQLCHVEFLRRCSGDFDSASKHKGIAVNFVP